MRFLQFSVLSLALLVGVLSYKLYTFEKHVDYYTDSVEARFECLKGQNACFEYYKSICWQLDLKDPANVKQCWGNFMSKKQFQDYLNKHSI